MITYFWLYFYQTWILVYKQENSSKIFNKNRYDNFDANKYKYIWNLLISNVKYTYETSKNINMYHMKTCTQYYY